MLVLSRRRRERLRVGRATLTVMHCSRRGVQLGIEAPDEVPIVRGELEAWRSALPGELWRRDEAPARIAKLFRRELPGDLVLVLPPSWRALLLPIVAGRLVAEHEQAEELVFLLSSASVRAAAG